MTENLGDKAIIVVIDDEESICQGCRQVLEDAGYWAYATTDALRGVILVKKMKPDVVLIDLRMPEMSGMEVLKEVRGIDAAIAPIVITGYGSIDSAVQAMKLGARDYLCKPFDDKKLLEIIEYELGRVPLGRARGSSEEADIGSQELKTRFRLDEGTQINFRPIQATDMSGLKMFFQSLSRETLYCRFLSHGKRLLQEDIRNFVNVDDRSEVAIVGTIAEEHREDIIADGRYYLDPKTNRAELALVVQDRWQNKGIGTLLLKYLASIAKRRGVAGFTAEVLRENRAMQTVLSKSDCKVTSRLSDGVYSYRLDFA